MDYILKPLWHTLLFFFFVLGLPVLISTVVRRIYERLSGGPEEA
ncbi:MAG: hypothetical protein N2561_04825 [Bacteroidetes bacterium]|nr:hypothetical protein [Rhodothermia bacterium]MCS7154470.1 hypothetical protein [Bacteroidota bacterium]MCX7906843.1 hypothetical protein [Bacteroidota bacterium]MDW8136878.1 hypothetical protein [Bacteroidota bacterium]MDW8285252.1 hypothetical protein [Bacteroidota bacterium]